MKKISLATMIIAIVAVGGGTFAYFKIRNK